MLPYGKWAEYTKCVNKGSDLLTQLNNQSMQTSIYTTYSQVRASGWIDYSGPGYRAGCESMLSALGWNRDDFKEYSAEFPDPPGEYVVYVNTVVGAIVIAWANSPRWPDQDQTTNTTKCSIPPVRRLSDFMFLAYQKACESDADSAASLARLEWVIHHSTTNSVSMEVVKQITNNKTYRPFPVWPGTEYTTTTDEGKALVGCPSGWGVAFMLGQHRQTDLGIKIIDKIHVFADKAPTPWRNPNLAFHLK
ncbi:hypothetical protein MMC10_008540 [Thelotrema lepadinum]|nr:hypothetical protein [Thelotrema lepadinum]